MEVDSATCKRNVGKPRGTKEVEVSTVGGTSTRSGGVTTGVRATSTGIRALLQSDQQPGSGTVPSSADLMGKRSGFSVAGIGL